MSNLPDRFFLESDGVEALTNKHRFPHCPAEGSMAPQLWFAETWDCGGCKESLFIFVVYFERDCILIRCNHDVILQLLMFCLAFTPTPDVSDMKDLLCDMEIKSLQDNTTNNRELLLMHGLDWCALKKKKKIQKIKAAFHDVLLYGTGLYNLWYIAVAFLLLISKD